jgi:hypothetical protein
MKDDFLTLMDAALEFRLGVVRGRLYDLALAGRLGEVQRRGRQLFVSRAGVAAYQRSATSGEPIGTSSGTR